LSIFWRSHEQTSHTIWSKEVEGVEDYHLWKLGHRFYNVETVQVLHRIHASSAYNAKGNHLQVKELLEKYTVFQ
jgi:hypothetical protein